MLGLKVGTITDTSIMGQPCTDKAQQRDVTQLNSGILNKLIVTDKLSTTGYNLVTVNHIIFLGSLQYPPRELAHLRKLTTTRQ